MRPHTSNKEESQNSGIGDCPALAIVLYGPSGVGKTSFAANFPKCGFIVDPKEHGIDDLVSWKQCPEPVFVKESSGFEEAISMIADAAGDEDLQTLVLDSGTGFEHQCFEYHCDKYFEGDRSSKGFTAYQQGPANAAKVDWVRFLDALEDIRKAGKNVIFICHSQTKNVPNPEGADYDKYIPYLHKDVWAQTHRWAQCILFYNNSIALEKKGTGKAKAKVGEEQRFIYTTCTGLWDAKNRFGLSPSIEAGDSGESAFAAFQQELLSHR